jgi:hypothetical protein
MTRNESLVTAEVAWHPLVAPHECLVTWEISGGGLKGNMLTETSNVQLSLWPDTRYRVQVTCKNKVSLDFFVFAIKKNRRTVLNL